MNLYCYLGLLPILVVFALIAKFVYNHYVVKTDLSKYGAKAGAWAVVTGAREGIGRGFALALAQAGFNVVLNARNEAGLKDLAKEIEQLGVQTKVVAVDCGAKNAVSTIVDAVKGLDLAVLVNNVGINTRYPEDLTDHTDEDIDGMIAINIAFTTHLTKQLIPLFKTTNHRGLIFNLSSFTGRTPVPMMSVYSASKAYIDVFSRALTTELKPKKIDVTSVLPHYVVSVMSGIRRANWAVPDALPFAKAALAQATCGDYAISPHWFHDISSFATSFLPDSLVGGLAHSKMKTVRKKLIARDEREATKAK